ncbi:MAG TPA: YhcH/YjgK/YiaL family protein [Smithellaceae bacterium]|nr:YhcH/YjgK/YiaL family protein [Smithellaceae bacterium]
MIFDSIDNLPNYVLLHPLFSTVVEFVNKENPAALKKGRIKLQRGVLAIVDEYETKDITDTFIECHRKYIDIQIILSGEEQIGLCHKKESEVSKSYQKNDDYEKLTGHCDLLTLRQGYFAVFYPQDGHAPGLWINNKSRKIKKLVFKIPVCNYSPAA